MDQANEHNVTVHLTSSLKSPGFPRPRLCKLARAICERFGLKQATIGIAILTDGEITELNKRFLGKDCATDCLSFDLSNGRDDAPRVFDLAVNGEMAARQAHSRGHSFEAELALYVAHAMLHNLGFDDSTPHQARRMHKAEDEILQQEGFGSVYNKKRRPGRSREDPGR